MTPLLLLPLLLLLSPLPTPQASGICPPYFDEDGDIHIAESLVHCAVSMSDAYQPITHVQKYLDMGVTLDVSVRFEFNNLISVNELDNTVSLDFFFRLWWTDVRWNLTKEFWDEVPTSVYYDGIEMYPYLFEADSPLPLWRPDLHFIDIFEVNEEAGLLKLRPGMLLSIIQYTSSIISMMIMSVV
jgi:hypothetical protein